MKITLRKFRPYPKKDPIGYAIAFNTTFANKDVYRDIIINYEDTIDKTKLQIVRMAWNRLKDRILTKVISMDNTSPKIGDPWEPINLKDDVLVKITELGLDPALINDDILDDEIADSTFVDVIEMIP